MPLLYDDARLIVCKHTHSWPIRVEIPERSFSLHPAKNVTEIWIRHTGAAIAGVPALS